MGKLVLNDTAVLPSEKLREMGQEASHKKAKCVQMAVPAELEVTPNRQGLEGARCAAATRGGVQDCSAAEGGFAGFWGGVPVLMFSCKPSLAFKCNVNF